MDIKTLEHHHNALTAVVNALALAVASDTPHVLANAVAILQHGMRGDPAVPDVQRVQMERFCKGWSEVIEDHFPGE